jgi:hypothetical protein
MVELNELVGGGMLIFGALSLLYGIALCYTVKVCWNTGKTLKHIITEICIAFNIFEAVYI